MIQHRNTDRGGSTSIKRWVAVLEEATSLSLDRVTPRPKRLLYLILLAWCGIVSGLLEVGAIIVRKHLLDFNRLYWMSRHFVWIIPLINLLVLLIVGIVLAVAVLPWWPRGRWLVVRTLCVLTVLPPIWAVSNRIIGPAGFLIALGVAARLVPALERRATGFQRLVSVSFPFVVGAVPFIAATLWGVDQVKLRREGRGRLRRQHPQTSS